MTWTNDEGFNGREPEKEQPLDCCVWCESTDITETSPDELTCNVCGFDWTRVPGGFKVPWHIIQAPDLEEDGAIDNTEVTCPECNSSWVEEVENVWECMACGEAWADD